MFSVSLLWSVWIVSTLRSCAEGHPLEGKGEFDGPLDCHLPDDYSTEVDEMRSIEKIVADSPPSGS